MRVLVADDNVDAANVLQMLLGILGHQVAVAYDGRAAVEKFLVERPQLCILDIGMPDMSGLEVAEAIRAVDPSTYLVALSGWCQAADRAASSKAGFNEHFGKPASAAVVESLVSRIAAQVSRG